MKLSKYIISMSLSALALTGSVSCTDYLDKAPNSDIAETVPYQNFRNFQGFVEELYNRIPVISNTDYHTCFNYGEEEYWEPQETRLFARSVDYGDFWGFTTCYYTFPSNRAYNWAAPRADKGNIWSNAWYSIRKANIGLSKLDQLVDATQEERDLIKGQLLFFRGFFHYLIMEWWGGMPYIDYAIGADEVPALPRETWQACADKCAADLAEAARLLPIDWDKTAAERPLLATTTCAPTRSWLSPIRAKCFSGQVPPHELGLSRPQQRIRCLRRGLLPTRSRRSRRSAPTD